MSDMCKMWCGCLLHKHNNDPCDGCRGVFTCRVHPEYEYDVLKRYEDWRIQAVAVEMDAALSFDDLDAIEFQIRQAREKVEEIQKKLKDADPADKTLKTRLETEMNQAKDKLLEAESNKDNLLRNKEDLVAWRKTRKGGEYLRKYHGDIIKRRTAEKVTFYLHATNHILFGVTILNTVILALGSIKSN